jgi:hypothetical protein
VKDNNEYLGIFYFLKLIFQNKKIIGQTYVEMAVVVLGNGRAISETGTSQRLTQVL